MFRFRWASPDVRCAVPTSRFVMAAAAFLQPASI
ncbi:hypothetical protein BDSB_03080 [Burkholderia dolosa PC543]|nr:hypothetical protein BDSB_03080 [Burkholderia dolosa PC543]